MALCDRLGWLACEASFRLNNWMDARYQWLLDKDRYRGPGRFLTPVANGLYELGCWLYSQSKEESEDAQDTL